MSDEREHPKAVNPHTGQPYPDSPPNTAAHPEGSLAGEGVASNAAAPGPGTPAPAPARGGEAESNALAGEATTAPPAGSAPTVQELGIRSALETVMDPEIGLSVIDLGLIREIMVQPSKTLVRMMLTTPFCPYAPQLMADVKQAAQSVVDQETEVEIMPDAWSPELMPDPSLLGYSF